MLAVQGGGQILLPQNFQGGSINLKSLQGLKMIPIQQTTQQANSVQLSEFDGDIGSINGIESGSNHSISFSDPQSTQVVNPPTPSSAGDS